MRYFLQKMWGRGFSSRIPILYGGSVDAKNIKDFLAGDLVQGALVGSASLNPKEFIKICSVE